MAASRAPQLGLAGLVQADVVVDDAADLIALLQTRTPKRRPGLSQRGVLVAHEPSGPAPIGRRASASGHGYADMDVVDLMVALQPRRERACIPWQQRSESLLQYARQCKLAKALEREAGDQRDQKQLVAEGFNQLQMLVPGVARTFGQVHVRRTRADMAEGIQLLALLPTSRDPAVRTAQRRAVSVVVAAALQQQRDWLDYVIAPSRHDGFQGGRCVVLAYAHQFDEATQRCRALLPKGTWEGLRCSLGPQAVHMMLQQCLCSVWTSSSSRGEAMCTEPWFCMPLLLRQQNADAILDGLIRRMAINIEDKEKLINTLRVVDAIFLQFGADRFSANLVALSYVWYMCWLHFPAVYPHFEPCWSHGVSLAKCAAYEMKPVIAAAGSLSSLLRKSRNVCELRSAMVRVVKRSVVVRYEPMPPEVRARTEKVLSAVYGDVAEDYQYHQRGDGRLRRTMLRQDLDDIACVACLAEDPYENVITHYCYTDDAIRDFLEGRRRLGEPCCDSYDDVVEKVGVPLINFACGAGWVRACTSRWTNVTSVLKRMAVASAFGRLLPRALADWRFGWCKGQSLEAALGALVTADRDDYVTRTRLKLVRVEKALSSELLVVTLGAMLHVMIEVDRILWAILGHERRKRADLLDMAHPRSSPVAIAQGKLCSMLREWGPASQHWEMLFSLAGHRASSVEARSAARRLALQASAGIMLHFDVRLSKQPYTLLWLCLDLAGCEKQRVAQEFYNVPEDCLPLFARRLRRKFSSATEFAKGAPPLIEKWALSAVLTIDPSERSHAQLRSVVASPALGKSVPLSSEQLVCQQVRAAHLGRGGSDARSRPRKRCRRDSHVQGDPHRLTSGAQASYLMFQNSRMQAAKKLHSPRQPLTAEQIRAVRTAAREQWLAGLGGGEATMWQILASTPRLAGGQRALVSVEASDPPKAFQPLWCVGSPSERDRLRPLPRQAIEDCFSAAAGPCKKHGDHTVENPPSRVAQVRSGWGTLQGCGAEKRGVCEHAFAADGEQDFVADLTCLVSSWVKRLTIEARRGASELVMFDTVADDAVTLREFALLVAVRDANPRMQIFAECVPAGVEVADEPPWVLRIATRIGRLCSEIENHHRSIALDTTHELARRLWRRSRTRWRLRPVVYAMVMDVPRLTDMVVEAAGDEFLAPARGVRQRAPRVTARDLMKLLNQTSAFDVCSGVLGDDRNSSCDSSDSDYGVGSDDGGEGEDEPFAFESDVLEDVADLIFDEAIVHIDGEEDAPVASDTGEEGVFDADAAAAAAEDEVAAAVAPIVEDFIALTEVGDGGYMRCLLSPLMERAMLARITYFPWDKPRADQNISCRCYLHPRCSLVRTHARWSEAMMIRWFILGVTPDMVADAAAHRALAARVEAEAAEARGAPALDAAS